MDTNNEMPDALVQDVEILVVEDSATQALQLQRMLQRNGYRVTVTKDGIKALEFLHEHPTTMVLTDIIMPQMDGYELCRRIKADEHLKHIPVILLTVLSDPMDVLKGLQCGADNFIVKPYDEKILLRRIHYILANRALREYSLAQMGIEVYFGGARHEITSERVQIVDLLLSVYETAVQKNVALQQAKEEAEKARLEAEKANAAKSEFLSRMSHELRTPLNAILGFAQILEMENHSEEQHESVEQILSGGRHLLSLINEVLDISRIEAGKMELSLEPVALDETLQEAANLIAPLATERSIKINVNGTANLFVQADRQRLKQVFLNLLSNAVKYNHDGGSITINCEKTGPQSLRVKVEDTGLAILSEDRDKLFQPFERLTASQRMISGTGLGLALSKHLMEAMRGTIGLDDASDIGQYFLDRITSRTRPLITAGYAEYYYGKQGQHGYRKPCPHFALCGR